MVTFNILKVNKNISKNDKMFLFIKMFLSVFHLFVYTKDMKWFQWACVLWLLIGCVGYEQTTAQVTTTETRTSQEVPYEGMPEQDIDETLCGKHTSYKNNVYIWKIQGERVLMVRVRNGKVTNVHRINKLYWDDDGLPHMEEKNGEKIWCINAQAAYEKWERFEQARDKEVDQYQSPEDYAEAHYDDFYEDALEYEEEDVDEVMYELAMEYWQENQAQPRPSY